MNRPAGLAAAVARVAGLIGLAALVPACGSDDDPAEAPSSVVELEQTAHGVMRAHRSNDEFLGAVMALHDPSRGTAVVTEGSARPGSPGTPVDPDVPWVLGSTTKTFVAVVVLQLAEDGALDLDAGIDDYFPDLPDARAITPRLLLQHRSGLNDYLDTVAGGPDAGREWTVAELVDVALANGPVGKPGGEHHYSNTNYVLLGELVELVTGRPWYEAVHERILAPLGMKKTHYAGEAAALPFGPGYELRGGQFVELAGVHPSIGGAAGAMQSTGSDLLRFGQALLAGSLLGVESRAAMFEFVPAEPLGPVGHWYGLGLEKFAMNELVLYGHMGTAPAHSSFVGFEPEGRISVAVLTNGNDSAAAPTMAGETVASLRTPSE